MSYSDIDYLRHIYDECNYLILASERLSKQNFEKDETLKRAFVRSLEIIGEATKKLSPEIRENYPDIEWKALARMRDKLIHNYFGIDYDIVWNVVQIKTPLLRQTVFQILSQNHF